MPQPPESIRNRLSELMDRCEGFLPPLPGDERAKDRGPRHFSAPRSELWRFLISSIQTVRSSCGLDSPHLRELERCREQFAPPRNEGLDLDSCRGALEAARDDLDAGMLADIKQLVAAEAFGDLLESAVHLKEGGYILPAVAVAGAVLESSLRSLAEAKSVSWNGSSSISKINAELYKAFIYDKVVHGEVEAWRKLRNKVDHGDFKDPGEIEAGAAQRMIDGVRDFVLKYR